MKTTCDMAVWKILMADDDLDDREIIKEALAVLNSDDLIHFADNGHQALEILEKNCSKQNLPSLVVLDLNMPKLNGVETLKLIKQKENLSQIPVVIYSTSINPLEKEICLKLGAIDFFNKPISFQESKDIAKKLLSFCTGK